MGGFSFGGLEATWADMLIPEGIGIIVIKCYDPKLCCERGVEKPFGIACHGDGGVPHSV